MTVIAAVVFIAESAKPDARRSRLGWQTGRHPNISLPYSLSLSLSLSLAVFFALSPVDGAVRKWGDDPTVDNLEMSKSVRKSVKWVGCVIS